MLYLQSEKLRLCCLYARWIKDHALKAYGTVDVKVSVFFCSSALNGEEWWDSCSDQFTAREEAQSTYQKNMFGDTDT
jgi:hypothetical protein